MLVRLAQILCGLAALTITPASGADAVLSEYCVLVNAQGDAVHDLWAEFDRFAEQRGLNLDSSHPAAHRYYDDRNTYEVNVRRFGPRGSLVSLHVFDESLGGEALTAVEMFVSTEVRALWEVARCDEVPGLGAPIVYQ